MSQTAFNWQMILALWGLVFFCAMNLLAIIYLIYRNQKIFSQNKNIILQLNKTADDLSNVMSNLTMMGQRVLALESNTIAVFHQLERRLKEQATFRLKEPSVSQAQTKAEASLLQFLAE